MRLIHRILSICLVGLAILSTAPAQAKLDANGFALSVCKLTTNSGHVQFRQGYGCQWTELQGRPLDSDEQLSITVLRNAKPEELKALSGHYDTLIKMFAQSLQGKESAVNVCSDGYQATGRKVVVTTPALTMLYAYAVCNTGANTHFLSSEIILKKGKDPISFFNSVFPSTVPLLDQ